MNLVPRFEGGGIHLPEIGLWLDPHTRQAGEERVFISHAHTDHLGSHREVILTPATAELMHHRLKGKREEHPLEFGKPAVFEYNRQTFQITLLSAGHILGSSMILIETGNRSLLYTGDFKLQAGWSAEPCTPCHADTLVMETTFGRPAYRFPDRDQVMEDIRAFCRRHLAEGKTPVLLAYSLGKTQELLKGLAPLGLTVQLHEEAWKITRIYEHFGHRFPTFEKLQESPAPGGVVVWPPHCRRQRSLEASGPIATAMVSGWAIDPRCRYQMGVDAAFPLSDHADYDELIGFVKQVAPAKILTLHGFAADFAQTLRDLDYDAGALSEPDQLGLKLGI